MHIIAILIGIFILVALVFGFEQAQRFFKFGIVAVILLALLAMCGALTKKY